MQQFRQLAIIAFLILLAGWACAVEPNFEAFKAGKAQLEAARTYDEHKQAITQLRAAVDSAPNIGPWQAWLGKALIDHDLNESIVTLRRAVQLDETFPAARVWLAEALLRQNDGELTNLEAKRWLDAAVKQAPDSLAPCDIEDVQALLVRLRARMTKAVPVQVNPVDGAELVQIPGGVFRMGFNDPERAKEEEGPAHWTFVGSYAMCKYEVTLAQYRSFCFANGRALPPGNVWRNSQRPVVNVSWQEAMDYAKWAQGALPTEAQWEHAARGGDGRPYPWGEGGSWPTVSPANVLGAGDGAQGVTAIGRYPHGASPYGVEDLLGNVWEWCRDAYVATYHRAAPVVNPGYTDNGDGERVRRGGASAVGPTKLTAATRDRCEPRMISTVTGFRYIQEQVPPLTASLLLDGAERIMAEGTPAERAQAEQLIAAALVIDPANVKPYALQARIYVDDRKPAEAVGMLMEALKREDKWEYRELLGDAYLAQQRWNDAVTAYAAARVHIPADVLPPQARLDGKIAALRATVSVTADLPECTVTLDETKYAADGTPIPVEMGNAQTRDITLLVEKTGYLPATIACTAKRGEQRVIPVTLKAAVLNATICVSATPAGSTVTYNKQRYPADGTPIAVEMGADATRDIMLNVERDGYQATSIKCTARRGEQHVVTVILKPAAPTTTLIVTSTPADGVVVYNGKRYPADGTPILVEMNGIAEREITVTVEKMGYVATKLTCKMRSGEQRLITAQLIPDVLGQGLEAFRRITIADQYPEVITLFRKAAGGDPENARAQYWYGKTLVMAGRCGEEAMRQEAITALSEALKRDLPGDEARDAAGLLARVQSDLAWLRYTRGHGVLVPTLLPGLYAWVDDLQNGPMTTIPTIYLKCTAKPSTVADEIELTDKTHRTYLPDLVTGTRTAVLTSFDVTCVNQTPFDEDNVCRNTGCLSAYEINVESAIKMRKVLFGKPRWSIRITVQAAGLGAAPTVIASPTLLESDNLADLKLTRTRQAASTTLTWLRQQIGK